MYGMQVIGVVSVIGLIWISAFYRLAPRVWTVLIGLPLFVLSVLGYLPLTAMAVFWIGFLAAAAFANFKEWRIRSIVKPLLSRLHKQIPTISQTERAAIEAGDTWWEKELFCGRPHWKKLWAIPRPTLSPEEQAFLNNQVEHVCSLLNDWEIVYQEHDLPAVVWDYLKREKFFGMVIPKQYGGLGFSALAHSTVITKMATRSVSAAVTTMVPNSLGPAELLLHYGTEAQKDYYLPRLACGLEMPCFALTGPDAGSDAGGIPDIGVVCHGQHEGQHVIGIRLNWDKRYITLAPLTTLLGLAFHLYDPEHLLGEKENIGITLCLIPASHPGVEIGHRHYPMHLAFMNGPTRGKDVFIPLDWIIGGVTKAGKGWKMLMESLSIGRSISLPALATACGKTAYRLTGAYAKVRRQFNMPLAAFEGIEEALGYIAGYTYLLEATRLMTAGAVDLKINPAIVSAIAKYHMTEMSRQVVSHAMDVHAGQMIQVGPRNVFANIYAAVPISITVEGANILTRNLIIFGQGAIRCHPYLLKEIELISANQPNLPEIDNVLMKHIGFYLRNFSRSLAYGLTGGQLIFSFAGNRKIRKYQRQLTRMSAALALLADTSLMVLGGSLKRRERLSARLGDILSQLYLASTVLKYFHDQQSPRSDVDYVCWALQECLYKIQVAMQGWADNFPRRWMGWLLYHSVFPWGQAYHPPQDKLHKALVTAMLEPSSFRDRLTQYYFISHEENDLSLRLEKALVQLPVIDPIWKKLQKAVSSGMIPHYYDFVERIKAAVESAILTAEEAKLLSEYEALRNEIIKVNEFSFDLSKLIA